MRKFELTYWYRSGDDIETERVPGELRFENDRLKVFRLDRSGVDWTYTVHFDGAKWRSEKGAVVTFREMNAA
ncbi:hypothetical protein [Gryllotalpicola koreensis]|uniref:DUF1348 family protein n=1 Tax=Gryllotalpicola koreensis TaxID=993086 RepID=A0ABP8A2C2_9MICO